MLLIVDPLSSFKPVLDINMFDLLINLKKLRLFQNPISSLFLFSMASLCNYTIIQASFTFKHLVQILFWFFYRKHIRI